MDGYQHCWRHYLRATEQKLLWLASKPSFGPLLTSLPTCSCPPLRAGGIVALPRLDGRPSLSVTAGQLTFSLEGRASIKAQQGHPHAALLHTKLRLSPCGHLLRITYRAALLGGRGVGSQGSAKEVTLWRRVPEA